MITKPAFEYSTTIQAEGMFARLYVNGAPLINHLRTDKLLFTFPITQYLRAGENEITVDYEPFDLESGTYTPSSATALQVELRQIDGSTVLAEVDLFSARWDSEVSELTTRERRVFGDTDLTTRGGNISGPSRFNLIPVDMNYGEDASGPDSRRVSFVFTIADTTLGTLPWDTVPVLKDTPEMRAALWAGYQKLHEASMTKNAGAYLSINDPMLRRIAYTLGYEKTSDLAQSIWKFSPLGGPTGSTVGPLLSEAEIRNAHLRWSADRRMVRVQQDPVAFFDAEGNKVGAYRVMFCQQPDGMMKVCHQMDIPY